VTSTTGRALRSRQRAREQRLASARERRRRLDSDRLAREQRIDEATVDVEDALAARSEAWSAVHAAELAAAAGIDRLVSERLSVADIVDLTGLDQSTVRRLRNLQPAEETEGSPAE
jgi:hypothetical protein